MTANKPYRILSLDGGGIRGLVSAILLECLEKNLQQQEKKPDARLKDYFEMIAGTSTGSIIVEDISLLRILISSESTFWSQIAKWCAIPKFCLIILGLVYIAVGGVIQLLHRLFFN